MPGGRIPKDNAVPDTTPHLQDSSLQQGDVSMLQEGQQLMKKLQKPAVPRRPQAAAGDTGAPDFTAPDPVEFISNKSGGTLSPRSLPEPERGRDMTPWVPLLSKLATSPGASGILQNAYVNMLRKINVNKSQGVAAVLHMSDYDHALERMLDELEQQ